MCKHCCNINYKQWWASLVAQSQLFLRPGLCTLTFVSIYDAKGSHSVKACVVLHVKLYNVLTIYTLYLCTDQAESCQWLCNRGVITV
jgi:hypothetical protein